jgi:hypothetical protein
MQVTLGLNKDLKEVDISTKNILEKSNEGGDTTERVFLSSYTFSPRDTTSKHGFSTSKPKTVRNSLVRAGTLSNTTNFPVTKWFEGPPPTIQDSDVLELAGNTAPMSPHLKRVELPNFSKVSPKATHRSRISSKKVSFIQTQSGTPTSMKSKQSKLYNPEKDKIKIVHGDMFDVNQRIGLHT